MKKKFFSFLFITIFSLSFLCAQKFNPQEYYGISNIYKYSVLSDEFVDNSNFWNLQNTDDKKYTIANGTLRLINYSNDYSAIITLNLPTKLNQNFEIEAAIKHIKGLNTRANGLLWGIQLDPYSDFGFLFSDNSTFKISQYVAEKYLKIIDWTKTSNYKSGKYNIFTIRKIANKYYFFINKKLVATTKNIVLKGNSLGFEIGKNSEIAVDYLSVKNIKTPANFGKIQEKKTPENIASNYYAIPDSRLKRIFTENFFDNKKDWTIVLNNPNYLIQIKNGYYLMKNNTDAYYSTYLHLPFNLSDYKNFQIEAGIYVQGNKRFENCLQWGMDTHFHSFRFGITPNQYFTIYKYTEKGIKDYIDYKKTPLVHKIMYNSLTVRKFNDKYYFFINQKLVFSHDFEPFFGNNVGFLVGKFCTMKVDYLYIWEIK